MTLLIVTRAANEIEEIKQWIDERNTEGAGERWVRLLISDMEQRAKAAVKHAICKNAKLAAKKFRCFAYKDKWIVAYRIEDENKFVIYRFIYGPKLI